MNARVRTAPSHLSILYLVKENSHNMNIEITIAEKSTFVMPLSCIGQITPVVPRISRMLKTLDPSTLPMAIPLLPFFAATTLVASGRAERLRILPCQIFHFP